MQKTVAIAALALLATACGQPASEPAAEPAASDAAAAAPADVPGGLAIDGKPNAGVFDVTHANGRQVQVTVNADGTTSLLENGKTTTGTWTSTGPGNYCDTYEGKSACYKEEIIDGVYTSTNEKDPKDVSTVKRVG